MDFARLVNTIIIGSTVVEEVPEGTDEKGGLPLSLTLPGSNIDVPAPGDPTSCGGYTGFNSFNPHDIYRCTRLVARRSQIARGFGKPVIQRMANGDLVASQYKSLRGDPNPNYPDTVEEAALCVSKDGGETWSEPRRLGLPGRATQFSILSDGVFILAAGSQLYRSEDRGALFQICEVPWEAFSQDRRADVLKGFGETNGVHELPDGSLIMTCFTVREPVERYDDFHCYAIRSTDRGKTWGDATLILNTDEVELLVQDDGKILGFARLDTSYSRDVWGQTGQTGEGGDQMAVIKSADGGRTWTDPKPIGLGMAQIPGFPVQLPDGRLLLIYGNRQFPFGVQAIASYDHGETWDLDHFLMLAYASWDNYGGHPRSILMPDDTIVTGYYARYFKDNVLPGQDANKDMVSHCLRWRVPDDWPPIEEYKA